MSITVELDTGHPVCPEGCCVVVYDEALTLQHGRITNVARPMYEVLEDEEGWSGPAVWRSEYPADHSFSLHIEELDGPLYDCACWATAL